MATTNSCSVPTLYSSLKHCTGQKVLPGVINKCYFISRRDIVSYPKLPAIATGSTAEKLSTYEGKFTLAADKKWLSIDLVSDKGQVECEAQGEQPSMTYLNKFTGTYPGIEEEATAFARQAIDDEFVVIIQQRNGKYRCLGGEAFAAFIKPKLSTGEGTNTAGGLSLEIQATDICPAPFYKGEIVTVDGTLNATL